MSVMQELKSLIKLAKELIAVWHWLSNLIALLTAISEHGTTAGVVNWLISGLVSSLIAEAIKAMIPTYLRPVFKHLRQLT